MSMQKVDKASDWKIEEYQGLSTDAKPVLNIVSGSTYYELNTGKGWLFDSININPVTGNGWWGV